MRSNSSLATSRDGRSTPSTPSSEAPSSAAPDSEDGIVEIAAHGDVVLRIEHATDHKTLSRSFRVSSPVLRTNSRYFSSLLQPGRFSEARDVELIHQAIRDQQESIAESPADKLPVVIIKDLGRIQVRSIGPLLTDFLCIIHGKDTQPHPPVANLANLAIVADRFDALGAVKSYVRRKKMVQAIDGRTTTKADQTLGQEKMRQRLLVGLLLDYPPWVGKYSLQLVSRGWVGEEMATRAALWWDLPSQIEEELVYRRESVLATIQSVQTHFLTLYTGRERLCKLGYDSSPQCDSFQLGEMMRFFTRINTLQFQGLIIDGNEPAAPYSGDINSLIDMLRQVPEYQIDRFHNHCGIRQRLLPLLDLLQTALACTGVCAQCWEDARSEYSWLAANRPLMWKMAQGRLRDHGHGNRHIGIREMFTASEHNWS